MLQTRSAGIGLERPAALDEKRASSVLMESSPGATPTDEPNRAFPLCVSRQELSAPRPYGIASGWTDGIATTARSGAIAAPVFGWPDRCPDLEPRPRQPGTVHDPVFDDSFGVRPTSPDRRHLSGTVRPSSIRVIAFADVAHLRIPRAERCGARVGVDKDQGGASRSLSSPTACRSDASLP